MLVCPLVFARDRSVGTRASEIEFVSRDDPLSRRPSPSFFPFGPLTSPPVAGVRENLVLEHVVYTQVAGGGDGQGQAMHYV